MQRGHCLCGSVQYEFDETQVGMALHCHCKDCQRVTGSGKATVIMFPQDAVKIEGEYKTFASRGFCLLYTSPSPRDLSTSRMPSSA